MNKKTIKKISRSESAGGDLRPEYRLDYSAALPNRFAAREKTNEAPRALMKAALNKRRSG